MAIGSNEFSWVAELVRREAAIVLELGKEYLVEARLLPLVREAGLADIGQFVRHAQQSANHAMRWAIVEALTTNETSWFRDATVFEGFRTQLLPQLLQTRPISQPLRIWSGAASTGQEAYSLAMLLTEELGSTRRFDILGTDISKAVLAQARAGRYTQMEVNRGLPARHLVRYFKRVGTGWQIDPLLQKSVTFREINLAAPLVGLPRFDVVFLRNVLIYFDLPTKQAILRRVRQVMAPGGWLVLGTAETTRGIDEEFEQARMPGLSAYRASSGASLQLSRRG